ncbi:hypothetical protein Nepgr_004204 [Nepenthes gracilis]|uniref:Uncharacterized protein n=1 Tax=Nepenthes gracilis TaxID=150966 RepID=A0AAD3S0X1_NEPGR|nr:hypothetical protein Nepgr_004204 [Nepenthes gracilis]
MRFGAVDSVLPEQNRVRPRVGTGRKFPHPRADNIVMDAPGTLRWYQEGIRSVPYYKGVTLGPKGVEAVGVPHRMGRADNIVMQMRRGRYKWYQSRDRVRCASRDAGSLRGGTVESHVGWGGERSVPYYKGVDTSSLRTRFGGGGGRLSGTKPCRLRDGLGRRKFPQPRADNIVMQMRGRGVHTEVSLKKPVTA